MKIDDGSSGLPAILNPHLVDGKYSIKDLVDIDRLRTLFDDLSKATGFTTGFVSYPEQEILIATGWRDICTKFHRSCPSSAQYCKVSNVELTACLKDLKESSIMECGNGLVDGATPVVIRGKHLASLATGQVLLAPPDIERFKEQARRCGYDTEKYLAALAQVPVMNEERIKKALSFLRGMAVVIAEEGLNNLRLRESGEILKEKIAAHEQATNALRKSEEKFRFLFTASRDAIVLMDRNGFLDCNDATLELFRYANKEQFFGKHPSDVSPPVQPCGKDSLTAAREHIDTAFKNGSQFFEWRHQHLDGTIFDTEVSLSRLELDGRIVLQALVRDISNRKQMEREILEISEFEKRRLGQDLQDDLCRRLASIANLGDQLRDELANLGLDQVAYARQVTELIGRAIDQTRNLARGLSPLSLVDGGLMEGLESLTVDTQTTFRIPCVFECQAPLQLKDEKLASHLYRIVQEALNNAAKHSNASRIALSLNYDNGFIKLAVTDNGQGGAKPTEDHLGMGMNIMRYRAHQIGATLEVRSAPGIGTTVTCSLPLPAHNPKLLSNAGGDSLTSANFLTLKKIGLTGRECEVLHWLAQGKRDGEIGTILSISLRTINHHVAKILGKLGVETRTAAATRAIELLLERG